MITTAHWRGRCALMVAHCAGMVDLVALPVWIGALIQYYAFDPQQAGMLATLFLGGAVAASIALAPRFDRLPARTIATAGFALAAIAFAVAARRTGFAELALLHAGAGLCVGAALSVTHGTIACSARPHRLFAITGAALGVFAVVFLGTTPGLVASSGGPALFNIFAAVMAVAAVAALLAFPQPENRSSASDSKLPQAPIPPTVWAGIIGIACMGLLQAMTFSFLERVGHDRGFGLEAITGVLVTLGLVNLLPAPMAGILEGRLPARRVLLTGPVLQGLLASVIMTSSGFVPYAAAASVFAAVMIFTHTFAFGLLARLDPSGRALAATPAMVMTGAALGPVLGGTLVKNFGYASLAAAAACIAVIAVACFMRVKDPSPAALPRPASA